jgi:hypothetical protein
MTVAVARRKQSGNDRREPSAEQFMFEIEAAIEQKLNTRVKLRECAIDAPRKARHVEICGNFPREALPARDKGARTEGEAKPLQHVG